VARLACLLALLCSGCLATRVQLADGATRDVRPAVADVPRGTAPVHGRPSARASRPPAAARPVRCIWPS